MLYRLVSNEQISRDFLQQISKQSLLPFGVLALKIIYIHKMSRFQCFGPNHDISISNKGLYEADFSGFCEKKSIKLHICSFSANQYQT